MAESRQRGSVTPSPCPPGSRATEARAARGILTSRANGLAEAPRGRLARGPRSDRARPGRAACGVVGYKFQSMIGPAGTMRIGLIFGWVP
ncbi:hypothetical protein GCM10011574_25140 [Microbispora bryophytorum]|uniref:Uncharacterized protein n=1 Tax=Microbispora bryophytorum TaxID=1460882 RepID=A0A8H9GXS5_9ACTN|nr:hypothetical protein GCM10011574_25140 [Microbispora bryophytorum]